MATKTLIRNPSTSALALPMPMQGVLPAGGAVVVDAPIATVRGALAPGGRPSPFELSEVDNTPGDAFYLGNLLNPLATAASVAALSGKMGALQSSTALDGSAPASQVLLAAGHTPGMYLAHRSIVKRLNPTAGSLVTAIGWKDGGTTYSSSNTQSLTAAAAPGNINPGIIACFSDGSADITCAISFTSMNGPTDVDVRSWVVRQQT